MTGSAFTQVFAQFGYQVIVSEVNEELLNKGLTSIKSKLTESVNEGELSQHEKDSVFARIKGTTNLKDFSDRDLMIEAVVEKMEVKKRVFAAGPWSSPNPVRRIMTPSRS